MTKRVQLAGGLTETEQFLVGLERELRVDLENDNLRLHDGVKPGGYVFLNVDHSDARYQARSLELDGFSFAAQDKGIMVRVGPAQYKLRKLTAHEGQFSIENPRGTADNFYFELLGTITTDHTWTGVHTFEEQIIANGGIAGDLTGDTFGTHTGPMFGHLEGTGNGDFTGTFFGDVDVRGHTIYFDVGQIPLEALDPAILVARGVPTGAILLWSGAADAIPESWVLCNGENGTPDLRDRFVVGAGLEYNPGQSGGSAAGSISGTLAPGGAHSHTGMADGHAITIAEMPAHYHGNGVNDGTGVAFLHGSTAATGTATERVDTGSGGPGVEGLTSTDGEDGAHTHTLTVDEGGAHSHDLTLDDVTLLPPYYALCYIMKIA